MVQKILNLTNFLSNFFRPLQHGGGLNYRPVIFYYNRFLGARPGRNGAEQYFQRDIAGVAELEMGSKLEKVVLVPGK
jgi:hypothetical protein